MGPRITIETFTRILHEKVGSGKVDFVGMRTRNNYHITFNPKNTTWGLMIDWHSVKRNASFSTIANMIWDKELS